MFGLTAECKSQKWGFKKVKVQPKGSKCNWMGTKISHMLAPIIRLKLTRDAAFAYYFVPGLKQTTNFDPGVKIYNFTKVIILEPLRTKVC